MRIRRRPFRPCIDFRPAPELLMPRTLLSDIPTLLAANVGIDTSEPGPSDGGLCPVWTGPNEDPDPGLGTSSPLPYTTTSASDC